LWHCTYFKKYKMKFKILLLLMLPLLGFAQSNSNGQTPMGGTTTSENEPLEIKRNAQYNLEEIKVRWKKAALENCQGAPCSAITAPGAPTGVVATAGVSSASVVFMAPTNNGGSAITGYTVTSSPGGITATGTSLSLTVTGLTNGTAYTFTVVATNVVGNSVPSAASTAVAPAAASSCPNSTITDVDGNIYRTVFIGTQCWTMDNLRVTKYSDGTTPIPDETATANTGWGSLGYGARTEYVAGGLTGYVSTYGYLYNWYAVAGIITAGGASTNNICPTGWHVPINADWIALEGYLGGSGGAGGKMKENVTGLWNAPNTGADNTSGFTALPAGYRYGAGDFSTRGGNAIGSFGSIGENAFFWSATQLNADYGSGRNLYYNNIFMNNAINSFRDVHKSLGASVRCLLD
jgi:uncharacterized protein (TIGR02145 family)